MNDEITSWLKDPGKDYKKGVELFTPLTRNKYLLKQLARQENKRNLAKLVYELTKLKNRYPDTPKKETPTPLAPTPLEDITPDPIKTGSPQEDKISEKLEITLARLHNKKGILSNSLRDFKPTDNAGRKAVLKKIEDITQEMDIIRTGLNYYHTHGTMPPLEDAPEKNKISIPADPLQMKDMLLNLRSSRTKIKTQIAQEKDEARITKLTNRLEEKINLINEIETRLNGKG